MVHTVVQLVQVYGTRSAQTDFRLPLVKTDISEAKISYSGDHYSL